MSERGRISPDRDRRRGVESDDLEARVAYYERQADEAAGYCIRADSELSLVRRELRQKTLAVRILSQLQDTIAIAERDAGDLFEATLARIHGVLEIDRSLVFLEDRPESASFRVAHHLGFDDAVVARLGALIFRFTQEELGDDEFLIVNRATPRSPFVELLRQTLGVRFFVCVPLKMEQRVFGYLLSSNDKEAYPFYPPFNRGHQETFSAIAGFLSASHANLSLYRDLAEAKMRLEEHSEHLEEMVRERTQDLQRKNDQLREEKEKSEELLLNILPRETAEELRSTGQALARSFEEVTVVFADIAGFSRLSDSMGADALVAELDQIFRAFDHIVTTHGLEKLKTIGDCYMFAGGIPVPRTDNALASVRAGLEMQRYIENRKQEKIRHGRPYFEMRFGVHTGPVVAGVVGSRKFAYDVWGSTVNVASFMESAGKVGTVNISGATLHRVRDHFHCVSHGKTMAKSNIEIDMYLVSDEIASEH